MAQDINNHSERTYVGQPDDWSGEWNAIDDTTDEQAVPSRFTADSDSSGGGLRRRTFLQALGAAGAVGLMGTVPAAAADNPPEYPSVEWYRRELENYEMVLQAPREQTTLDFQTRLQTQSASNIAEYLRQQINEPEWDRVASIGSTWAETFAGDPYRYPSVDPFYGSVGERTRIAFYDHEGARLSGRVWVPVDSEPGDSLPGVVIACGTAAPEPLYWWAAQTLVNNGYMVMTYDVRGQGRSDFKTPDGELGTTFNPEVFYTNQIAAIDFLHSTPDTPYPPTVRYGEPENNAPELRFNPYYDRLDRERLGIAGHSTGAIGVSIVQGLDPWPGLLDETNPVDAVVAWDNLGNAADVNHYPPVTNTIARLVSPRAEGDIDPTVPALGLSSDYYLAPIPKTDPPDPEERKRGFLKWKAASVPSYQVVIRGGTHYEYSLGPFLPATSWRPPNAQEGGAEEPFGFGNPVADYYTLAWFDRWLKQPGEQGYATADERLLDDKYVSRMSFYYESARDFPDRQGTQHVSEDIREDDTPEYSDDAMGSTSNGDLSSDDRTVEELQRKLNQLRQEVEGLPSFEELSENG